MLAPQFALELGVWGMLAYSTASFGLFAFAPMARRIREVMPRGFTAVEFIRRRYGAAGGVPFLLISFFYAVTWLVSMAMAGGKLLEVLAAIPYPVGMSVVLLVCVLYTLFGGMYAVIGTDFIQSVSLVVVAVAVLWYTDIGEIHGELSRVRPMLLNALFPAALMALFNNMLFAIGEIFHSNVWWSRAFAMRESVGGRAYALGGLLWLPVPVVAGFLGLAAPALGIGISDPDTVGPLVAARLLGMTGALMVFVVVFCSLASSIDSLLAASADLLAHDVVFPAMRLGGAQLDDSGKRWLTGGCVVALGLVAWTMAIFNVGTLAEVLFFAGPMVGSCIWPILGGLYFRRPGPWAAGGAMVAGSLSGLWAYFAIEWFVASLIGTAVSGVVYAALTWLLPASFDFEVLRALEDGGSPEAERPANGSPAAAQRSQPRGGQA
jgi:Na+/proline symporter